MYLALFAVACASAELQLDVPRSGALACASVSLRQCRYVCTAGVMGAHVHLRYGKLKGD